MINKSRVGHARDTARLTKCKVKKLIETTVIKTKKIQATPPPRDITQCYRDGGNGGRRVGENIGGGGTISAGFMFLIVSKSFLYLVSQAII